MQSLSPPFHIHSCTCGVPTPHALDRPYGPLFSSPLTLCLLTYSLSGDFQWFEAVKIWTLVLSYPGQQIVESFSTSLHSLHTSITCPGVCVCVRACVCVCVCVSLCVCVCVCVCV